jgi:hypothetical protein
LLVGIHQLRTMMTWLKGFNIEYDVTLKKAWGIDLARTKSV